MACSNSIANNADSKGNSDSACPMAAMCRRAVDMGVYPFIVPLRPIPGSLNPYHLGLKVWEEIERIGNEIVAAKKRVEVGSTLRADLANLRDTFENKERQTKTGAYPEIGRAHV